MKRLRLALLCAALMLTTVLGAAPALADHHSVSWDFSNGLRIFPGETELERLPVAYPEGSDCTANLAVTNNPSTHPGHILKVWLGEPTAGAALIELPEFENGGPTSGSAAFVATGEDLVVTIFKGSALITSHAGSLTVTCEPPDNGGGEGCTPGYWKQEHHFDSWTGYSPGDDFVGVFGVDLGYDTLLDALEAKGGKENALARHATAALLNASSGDVSYEFSTGEIIALVQAADVSGDYNGAKNILEAENEAGCPLN